MGTISEYWHMHLWRDTTRRIITINTIVWAVIGLGSLLWPAAAQWIDAMLSMPAQLPWLLPRMWTAVTYMFVQTDFLHLLANMLWLLLFGQIIEHALSGRKLWVIYIVSGLVGAAAFVASSAIWPGAHMLLRGASCAVMGVMGASMLLAPTWRVNLLIFGEVKVVWVAVAGIIFFIVFDPSLTVSIAHAAGLVAGLAYAWVVGGPYARSRVTSLLGKAAPAPRRYKQSVTASRPKAAQGMTLEQELDLLLAKVSRTGYASLTASERQRLFELSQNIKR